MYNKLYFRTLNGITEINKTMLTPYPDEFRTNGYIKWMVNDLVGKKYDAIIGLDILRPMKVKIDLEGNFMLVNDSKIHFNTYPFDIYNICTLESSPSPFLNLIKHSNLNKEENGRILKLLNRYSKLFYKEGNNLTFTHEVQHEIATKTDRPIFSKIYRYPKVHEQEIERQVNDMLKQGIITESSSPYNSPLWIVPKKEDNSGNKKWRIVIDYRNLNDNTIADKYPIPNIDSILDKLGKAQYFSTIDLAKGFHQILVKPEHRQKTAFSTPFGHYEFVRMPFGLKNAPATFQRLMNSVLREYINRICVVYLDDILVFSTSLQEHIDSLSKIFSTLEKADLKIQVDKCNFFAKETPYLGHILTPEGLMPNKSKIDAIVNLKLPNNQKQIKSFLGLTGYYRKFIRSYAKIAYPMITYLKKDKRVNTNDPNYIMSFEKLKQLITEHPILRFPDFDRRFKLTTDASNYALGAVLSQEGHPICFASRTLNDHEKNYSTIEKELLAIVWSVKYFRPYLYGREFDLHTDHQPLKWLQIKNSARDINPRLQRWLIQLGEYDAKIDYIKGKENKIADFLSRIDVDLNEIRNIEDCDNCNYSTAATIHSQCEDLNDHIPILDTVVNRFKIQIILVENKEKESETVVGNTRIFVEKSDLPNNIESITAKYNLKGKIGIYSQLNDSMYNQLQLKLIELYSHYNNISFVRCSFFAKDITSDEEAVKQISLFHVKESGHAGIIPNYEAMKHKIFFPNLRLLVQKVVNNCEVCSAGKYDRNPIRKKFKYTETPSDINEIVHVDTYVNSKQNFIMFIDKFSKHAVCFHLEDKNSLTLVQKLRLYISINGKMKKLVCDNEFNNVNVKQFCRNEEINIHFSKPNSHTGNSDVERLNNTITEKIRTLNIEEKLPIREQIAKAIELYNNTYHSALKDTPLRAHNGSVDKILIKDRLIEQKRLKITKLNEKRETYEETRQEGFIKNYRNVRHKEQPKYRKQPLANVHETNIKRPFKFSGYSNDITDGNINMAEPGNIAN